MTGRIVRLGVFLAVVLTTVPLAFAGKPLVAEPSSCDDRPWVGGSNYGKVRSLCAYPGGVQFRFSGGKTAMQPEGGWYDLPMSHPNYQAMYDLLYRAAEKRWKLYVRCDPKLNAGGHATANCFVVYFAE